MSIHFDWSWRHLGLGFYFSWRQRRMYLMSLWLCVTVQIGYKV